LCIHDLLHSAWIAELLAVIQNVLCESCVTLTMTKKVEQCICIRFCQQHGQSCSETYDVIQKGLGDEEVGRTQLEWCRWFMEGLTSFKSEECSRRPSMSRNQLMIDRMHSAMLNN
jgi:hypothetical protein